MDFRKGHPAASSAKMCTLSRRNFSRSAPMVVFAAGLGAVTGSSTADAAPSGARILVAHFSRTGNTRVVARHIQRVLNADLFEIEPATAYPEDYEATVAQAQRERDSAFQPPLARLAPNIGNYDTVFLGFPIWGETIPSVVRSFLAQHDLAAKTLVPFLTHGGYGQGGSIALIRKLAPRARVFSPFVLEADQERRTLKQVATWLSRVKIPA